MGQVLKCEKLIGYFMCGAHEFSIHEVTNEVTSKKKDDFHKLSLVKTHWRSDLAFSPTFSPNLPRKSDFRIANLRFATKLLLFRPILHLTRFDINKLCDFYNFPLYADKTNNIDIFRRNRIRTQLLPTLRLFFNKNLDFTLFRFLEISFYEKNFFDNLSRSLSKKVVGRLYRISQNFCPILENELCVPVSDEDLSEALKVVPSWKDQAKGAKGAKDPKVILSWKGRSKSRRTRKLYCNVLKAGGIRAPVANLRFATRGANQRFAQVFFENKYEISNTFLFFLPKSIRNKILYKILFFNKHIEGRTFLGKMGLKDSITFEEAFIRNQ